METELIVKSNDQILYEAFIKECEAMGWRSRLEYRAIGDAFEIKTFFNVDVNNGLVESDYHHEHCADSVLDLTTQFTEAVACAKKLIEQKAA